MKSNIVDQIHTNGIVPEIDHSDEIDFHQKIGMFGNFGSHLSEWSNERYMHTYWNDVFVGAQELYKEISDLFSISINYAFIEFDMYEEYQPVVNWLNTMEIEKIIFGGERWEPEKYMWTVENIKSSKTVRFETDMRENMEKETLTLDIGKVAFESGYWIKLRHLKSIESSEISLGWCRLSNEDLNQFLNALNSGSNPNLRKMYLWTDNEYDLDEILKGFEQSGKRKRRTIRFDNGDQCVVRYKLSPVDSDIEKIWILIKKVEELN